jgi:hypothetical protein
VENLEKVLERLAVSQKHTTMVDRLSDARQATSNADSALI